MTTDIVVDTSNLSDPVFIAKVRLVATCLVNHEVFKDPPDFIPTLAHLEEGAQRLEELYAAVKSMDLSKAGARKEARADLNLKYGRVGRYVDLACNGDPSRLRTTGFDLKVKGRGAKLVPLTVLPAPVVRLTHGAAGVIVVRARKVSAAASYQVQVTTGDPSVEEGWSDNGTYQTCFAIEIAGLTPGKTYGVRMRCISGTACGPWSVPCTLMAH
ncbi:hypothetical protein [Geomesophilobacter sediminis]|uniref:Fibronectin type-III domain-containing protein n=1 Tax=Geomesophilobacter sediminis TaxID=2798584 RepID=A0A8J7JFA1_9BACT|nr:hypothetical protein [Geomesophilobacter sediminis]MBJ6724929.1 hypothetical protein [Geomesophilobacter sediminis]